MADNLTELIELLQKSEKQVVLLSGLGGNNDLGGQYNLSDNQGLTSNGITVDLHESIQNAYYIYQSTFEPYSYGITLATHAPANC